MAELIAAFIIPIEPRTKKNSNTIYRNKRTGKIQGVGPSEPYKDYLEDCRPWLSRYPLYINQRVNVKAIYYMRTRGKVDLSNLHNALHDLLTDYGVVADDNSNIIAGTDGSRVRHDPTFPRTEIAISTMED